MRLFLPAATILLLSSFVAHSNQSPPRLGDVPADRQIQGALFSEAWIAFRREWDGLCTAKVREEESAAWLDAAPPFLLRDMLRSAMDPEVLYQVAVRLSQTRTAEVRRLLAEVQSRYAGTMLGTLLAAAQITAGEPPTRALADLASPVMERRASAATTLAAANKVEGLRYFRAAAEHGGEEGHYAVWALGRFGQPQDEKLLKKIAARRPGDLAPKAALGELFYRRVFPSEYAGYLTQYRFFSDGFTVDGQYETWLVSAAAAIESGARTVAALRTDILKQRRDLSFESDSELTNRRLSAFVDFLDEMSRRTSGPTRPTWPADIPEAVRLMRLKRDPEKSPVRITAERIAACLCLLATLGPAIDYPRFAEPTDGLISVSPNGERALDGNLATSRHLTPTGPLVMEYRPGKIRALWVLTACSSDNLPPIPFTVQGTAPNGRSWQVDAALSPSSFIFKEIPVNQYSDGRILIVHKSKNIPSSCITEIRADIDAR